MIRFCKKLYHFISAIVAVILFRYPARKMTVIGVTGTDGKTTTTHLIYHLLRDAGKKVSLISTIEAVVNGKNYDTGFHVTTPSPFSLQKFMQKAADEGSEYFVLEVTSHALDQYRILGSSIDIGVITNVSHEHLDYHRTFKDYLDAKAKILSGVKFAILNIDDNNFDYLKSKVDHKAKMVSFGVKNKADNNLINTKFKLNSIGDFNIYNYLAAASVGRILELDEQKISETLTKFKGIPGRMQEVENNKGIKIYIDFAHKPNALKEALQSARKLTQKKLMVVFGCAGLRDKLKRPMMGEIAGKLADYAVFTAEDPRSEDVRKIIEEIALGCGKTSMKEANKRKETKKYLLSNKKYFWRIPDRAEAINFAIRRLAQKDDLILICGKGHEKSMCYGKTEYPWDEQKAVQKALYAAI